MLGRMWLFVLVYVVLYVSLCLVSVNWRLLTLSVYMYMNLISISSPTPIALLARTFGKHRASAGTDRKIPAEMMTSSYISEAKYTQTAFHMIERNEHLA